MLSEFIDSKVDFMLVGAYALAAYGYPRATGDIDIWVRADKQTGALVYACLKQFGAPLHDLTIDDLSTPGMVFQIGVPPVRIDILTKSDRVLFEDAWRNRTNVDWDGMTIPIIGLADLIKNKRSTGRTKDLADAEQLEANLDD